MKKKCLAVVVPNQNCETLNFCYRLIPKIATKKIYLVDRQKWGTEGHTILNNLSKTNQVIFEFHFCFTLTFFAFNSANRFRIAFGGLFEWWMWICVNEYVWSGHSSPTEFFISNNICILLIIYRLNYYFDHYG